MRDFLKNLSQGSRSLATDKMERILKEVFINPVQTEWSFSGNTCEAIFYKDNQEHIAHFDKYGNLLDFIVNMHPDTIPAIIRKAAEIKGEIMNVLMISKKDVIKYEVIFRDRYLKWFLLLLKDNGETISEKRL